MATGSTTSWRIQHGLMLAGAACLCAALASASMLAAKRFGATLPGCGVRSACDALERTVWGSVPGLGWPVSFIGVAYFGSMLAPWIACRAALPAGVRWAARSAGAFSAVYTAVIISKAELCPYCLATHAANLAFVGIMEIGRRKVMTRSNEVNKGGARQRSGGGTRRTATSTMNRGAGPTRRFGRGMTATGALTFVLISAALGWADSIHQRAERDKAEADRRASVANIVGKGAGVGAATTADPNDRWGPAGFTGRYHRGPDPAPIRIVMLTDYQCPDCKRVEGEAEQVMASRKDVSLSIKHFPMCLEAAPGVPCNKYAGRSLHPNACWAARAAEAAGILGGDDAFWKMHAWLFSKEGRFETSDQLAAGVRQAGLDPASFEPVMSGPETLKRVRADVEDGVALGLFFTPMVFVNGAEMRGWQTPGALLKTVEEVAKTNPPARIAAADRPALAVEKYVADWREQPEITMPPDPGALPIIEPDGPADGKVVEVVVFGDYQEPFTAQADKDIRAAASSTKARIRYTFRVYPANKECNPALPPDVPAEAIRAQACLAARAAVSTGLLSGAEGHRKAHIWLMEHQQSLTKEAVAAAAKGWGVDSASLAVKMGEAAVTDRIADDCRAAKQIGLASLPTVYVNGKFVPRPAREGDNVLMRIIDAAGK